jgi:2-phosphosulfolactate phosphatase
MNITHLTLEQCAEATGVVVVVDVIRAFTTAAFAFASGAEDILLARGVEEALELRDQHPNALVMGEVKGLLPKGFDFGNSPSILKNIDLRDRRLIQRTSCGTQGVVKSANADVLLTGSFCCAQATADYIRRQKPQQVTFVNTGFGPDGRGDEDAACAEYLAELLKGSQVNPEPYLRRVKECRGSRYTFADPDKPQFPWEDIECCMEVDLCDFAMVVERQNGLLRMRPATAAGVAKAAGIKTVGTGNKQKSV